MTDIPLTRSGPSLGQHWTGTFSMLDILLLAGGTAIILLMDGYASLCARI